MEDLVLSRIDSTKRINSEAYTTPPEWPEASSVEEKSPSHSLVDSPFVKSLERPGSTHSRSGHSGPNHSQQSDLRSEVGTPGEAAFQAKQSISSLRKLALRLAVRISVKEAKISSQAHLLSQSRMENYLVEQAASTGQDQAHTVGQSHSGLESYPLSPPQSPGSSKPLPSLPRWNSSGRVTTVRFSPVLQHDKDTELSGLQIANDELDESSKQEHRLQMIDASRASLLRELESTQAKLRKLFEAQAVLRERYNNEREKARNLDAECQETHAKVVTLEQSKQEAEEEAQQLNHRIVDLEQGNSRLRIELETAKTDRANIQEDLSRLQSSKLTLEHQLQAATASKDAFEARLNSLEKSSDDMRLQLEEKSTEMQKGTEQSDHTIKLLELERKKLDEELTVTKFRLAAAVDLESVLRSKLETMRDHGATLQKDLQTSRQTIAKLRKDLQDAKERLSDMDKTVSRLTAELQASEETKIELERAATLAQESKERSELQLRKHKSGVLRTAGRLRTARSRLFASENKKKQAEDDLAAVRKRNEELEILVHKSDTVGLPLMKASTIQPETNVANSAEVSRPEYISCGEDAIKIDDDVDVQTAVGDQLLVHQREIDNLHETNATLMEKLNQMTQEIRELKEDKTVSQMPDRATNENIMEATALLDLEIKELQETKTTFNRIVHSLQSKTAQLEALESGSGKQEEGSTLNIEETVQDLALLEEMLPDAPPEMGAAPGAVNVQMPHVVHDDTANYAKSEAAIVETPAHVLTRSASDHAIDFKREILTTRNIDTVRSIGPLDNSHQLSHTRTVSEGMRITGPKTAIPALVPIDAQPTTPMELSAANLAQLNQNYHGGQKELPQRPSFPPVIQLPQSTTDKKLPSIPRRPVPVLPTFQQSPSPELSPSRPNGTKDDIDVGRELWSLFPAAPRSNTVARPVTSAGHGRGKSTSAIVHESRTSEELGDAIHEDTTVHALQDRPRPRAASENRAERFVRLRRSFSSFRAKASRPHRVRENAVSEPHKKWMPFMIDPNKTPATNMPGQHEQMPRALPHPKSGHEPEPVGIYDPVAKMWLIPQASHAAHFGIYDPESKQWLTPSPRNDSYHLHVKPLIPEEEDHDDGTSAVSIERDGLITQVEIPVVDGHGEDVDEEEGVGALSLAEKLEIIRYNPMTRTLSTTPTNTTLRHKSSTITSVGEISDGVLAPRPWKAAKVLGIPTPPPTDEIHSPEVGNSDDDVLFSAKNARSGFNTSGASTETGSGYMSFESDYDGKRKDWKGIWKKIKHSSNLRKSMN
ncbi:hypothetical protein EJ08DRAFT_44028 [Tothia fuscella]|uniref:Uncharacterized protein n=1 Tax=Tothia fuscella TaxID=1048955 RepID=A0A9P4NFT8_9PEZI|nr:hypothetical protein EJ08DRAFT_44028 [Tothia fuscella]